MIEPTDEMKAAVQAVLDDPWEGSSAIVAAVLALVERDYHIEPRPSAGSATRCGCPPGLCYGRASRRPGQECGAVLDRGAP